MDKVPFHTKVGTNLESGRPEIKQIPPEVSIEVNRAFENTYAYNTCYEL